MARYGSLSSSDYFREAQGQEKLKPLSLRETSTMSKNAKVKGGFKSNAELNY